MPRSERDLGTEGRTIVSTLGFTRDTAALARAVTVLLTACVLGALAAPASARWPEPPCPQTHLQPTVLYNTASGQDSADATIKVVIADGDGSEPDSDWGGGIIGIYYRPGGGTRWDAVPNMIDDWDPGRLLQVALRQGPFSRCVSEPTWNPTQGGDAFSWLDPDLVPGISPCDQPYDPVYDPHGCSPAWKTGGGTHPVPWYSIRTYPYDWSDAFEECAQLDQTVYVWSNYIEIEYAISGHADYSCYHPVMFHEVPAVFAHPNTTYWHVCPPTSENPDPGALSHAKLYDGSDPWTGGELNENVWRQGGYYSQVYPSEDWIGLFTPTDGYGLTLAHPRRARHQPYCHMWSFYWDGYFNIMWSRPFFDFDAGSDEAISWTVYLIPGTVEDGRHWAYKLLPHRRWEFDLEGNAEGWHPRQQLRDFRVEEGTEGVLKAGATGPNPWLESLDMLDFAADSISGIEIEMAVRSSAGTKGYVWWTTEEEPTWDEADRVRDFDITADGAFRTYSVQLRGHHEWRGTIRQLRLQPTDAETPRTDGIRIRSIRLVTDPIWEFNADGNNEGWAPVTTQLRAPPWDPESPLNATDGRLLVISDGVMSDTHTYPTTDIYPALLGPYPSYIEPPDEGETRYVKLRIRFPAGPPNGPPVGRPNGPPVGRPNGPPVGRPDGPPVGRPNGPPVGRPVGRPNGPPGGPTSRTVRLRYTCTDCPKQFEYHPQPRPEDPEAPRWPDRDWPDNKLVTRFDLWDCDHQSLDEYDCDHQPIVWPDLRRPVWRELVAELPAAGTIDQLMLEFDGPPGHVLIDYIRVEYE
jgi:hypothetical protein